MNDRDTGPEVIIIYRSGFTAWLHSAVIWGALLGMIGVGVWLDSTALQWVAALMWFLSVVAYVKNLEKRNPRTPQEAADWLYCEYGVKADTRVGDDIKTGLQEAISDVRESV